jgi:hypothetical protein
MAGNDRNTTTQPQFSSKTELLKAHLGLAYTAIGKFLKEHPKLVVGLHSVLLLELVRLGHVQLTTCQKIPLKDHLRNPSTYLMGKNYDLL